MPPSQRTIDAVRQGSDLVELDYYVTKDGIHAVFHDKTLDRTTDACKIFGGEKLPVVDRSWEELKRLDAGSWYDAKFKGEPIPRLENALDEEYATRVAAGVVDGGGPILVSNVGAPQTLRLTYSYDF